VRYCLAFINNTIYNKLCNNTDIFYNKFSFISNGISINSHSILVRDKNCFFRSVAYVILGMQEKH